ncbi:low molecular weight phosphotyrosine protein phosphatase [Paenibacillus mesophilus]|uniref:low molecular weight protein-tyrosine-phosphatase n=1 Tax=Paenibacillus mesophilus TaxID=2582849 RepID=UPI00110E05B3|nr:low molecular weight protein-tyrosine-phosphatase [Paenibacillus mesophilus]TMV52122.1 low molecular weight phosphotyrosine protein phosphatase [Paenibacillus mesophilus]
MIRVLFVCLGNICRSPMAEAVMRSKVKEAGLDGRIGIDSAGTGDWHIGKAPHEGTRKLLDEKRISWEGITARQVAKEDLKKFDYIVAMDSSNMTHLQGMAEELGLSDVRKANDAKPKLCRLLDFVPEEQPGDVPDPYYTGNFQETYRLVDAGCDALLERIKHQLV